MNMKTRIYVDTSVFSALSDERMPERMALTMEFWARRHDFDLAVSDLVREELERISDPSRRQDLLARLKETRMLGITEDMNALAYGYVQAGCFPPAMFSDALHVAVAVLSRQDILVSWNFRHMVNRTRRARVNAMNIEKGLPVLDILAPPEV